MKRTAFLFCAAVLAFAPAAAMAQWSDGFEAYANNQLLDNVGGWAGWDNSAAAAGTATNAFAHTGENSILITGGADAVHPLSGKVGGEWTLTAWMLLNTADHTTDTFFIVNNLYNHGGPYLWTIEMQFDVTTGEVLDDFRPHTPIPILYDQWAEIRIEFNLGTDAQTTYYNNVELSTGTMTRTPGDPLEIANIDLFTLGATSYYDDFNLVPEPSSCLLVLIGVGAMLRRRR